MNNSSSAYDPWSRKADRAALAERWDVSIDKVLEIIEEQGFPLYLPLSEVDVREIRKALEGRDSNARVWRAALRLSKRRANRRCANQPEWVHLARGDFFHTNTPPFPGITQARDWLARRFEGNGMEFVLPGDDGLTPPPEDHMAPDWDVTVGKQAISPRSHPEGSWERLREWAELVSGSAAVTPSQGLAYILTGDVCGCEPPVRVAVIEKVGRSPVIQMAVDCYVPSSLVRRAYAVVSRLATGRARVRLSPRERSAHRWPISGLESASANERAESLLTWMEAIAQKLGGSGGVSTSLARTAHGVPAIRYVVRPFDANNREDS